MRYSSRTELSKRYVGGFKICTLYLHFTLYCYCYKIKEIDLAGTYLRRTHWADGKCVVFLVEKPEGKRSLGTCRLDDITP